MTCEMLNHILFKIAFLTYTISLSLVIGGCGPVGRALASDNRDLQFKSSHRDIIA